MAFGSAAPEIVINALTTIKSSSASSATTASNASDTGTCSQEGGASQDSANLGVGAIIGSGLIAFSVIPGACALFSGGTLELKRRPLVRDLLAYLSALIILCVFFSDGIIKLYEGIVMVVMYAVYVVLLFVSPKVREWYRVKVDGKRMRQQRSFVAEQMERRNEEQLQLAEERLLQGEEREYDDESGEGSTGGGPGSQVASLPWRIFGAVAYAVSCPFKCVFRLTCPDCESGAKYERLYPLTFVVSFLWVALFSFTISSVVERWVAASQLSGGFFGLFLISIGAEIPDTIQSVTVAKRGYGSMAVSNAVGSQIINVLIGLGLPWTIANAVQAGSAGWKGVALTGHAGLQVAAFFQAGVVVLNFAILIGMALIQRTNKAMLTRRKGIFFICLYLVAATGYIVVDQTVIQAH